MANKKRAFIEDMKLILKGIGTWQKMMPNFVPYLILDCIFTCLQPYFPLYMSAQIVNELTGSCDLRRLLILAGIAVAGSFVLSLSSRFFKGRFNTTWRLFHPRHEAYLFHAANHFQYEHLEDPEVVLARTKITSVATASGVGLPKILFLSEVILRNILNVVVSVSLTVSLFRVVPCNHTGFFAFINSPWAVLVLVAMIAIHSVLSVH